MAQAARKIVNRCSRVKVAVKAVAVGLEEDLEEVKVAVKAVAEVMEEVVEEDLVAMVVVKEEDSVVEMGEDSVVETDLEVEEEDFVVMVEELAAAAKAVKNLAQFSPTYRSTR